MSTWQMDREASKSKRIPSTEVQRRKSRIIGFRCYTHTQSIDSFGDKAYRVSLGSEVGKGVDKSLMLEATQRKSG